MSEIAMTHAEQDRSGVTVGRALVAAVLYYTPVTILSLSAVDWPRAAMMALYLLPFAAVPVAGLVLGASRRSRPRAGFAVAR